MITLERVTPDMWTDEANTHVIVHEWWEHSQHAPGFYVRDEDGERGPFRSFAEAFNAAEMLWAPVGDVELGPARRLRRDVAEGRADEVGHFLLEYLAEYGAVGIDVKDLAENVLTLEEGPR